MHSRAAASGRRARTIGSTSIVTPYAPEQNGMIERFFPSLKEECVWQHSFPSFVEARCAVLRWIRWYNEGVPIRRSATSVRETFAPDNFNVWL
jgi:hypothetical protein